MCRPLRYRTTQTPRSLIWLHCSAPTSDRYFDRPTALELLGFLRALPAVLISLIAVLFGSTICKAASANWLLNGLPIATNAAGHVDAVIANDAEHGLFLFWTDYRVTNGDVYMQHLDAGGDAQLPVGGVAVCTAPYTQRWSQCVSDMNGGAILAWIDFRNGAPDLYAQRFAANGMPQWSANGIVVCGAPNTQQSPSVISDGAGGAIVAWNDLRSFSAQDVYAQRIGPSGTPYWTPDGVPVCTATNHQWNPLLVADESGGAIIVWTDFRSGPSSDIYAQRILSNGQPAWPVDGIPVSAAVHSQETSTIVADGSGGAVIAWADYRYSGDYVNADVFSQRIDASGNSLWTTNGILIVGVLGDQTFPHAIPDGANGAIVAWTDYRADPASDIYAQRVNAGGLPQWSSAGVPICAAPDYQYLDCGVSDNEGGAVLLWRDRRNGLDNDIYMQRVAGNGAVLWSNDGAAVCIAKGDPQTPQVTVDGSGVFATWLDNRANNNSDVYAQRIDLRYGEWGHPEPRITSVTDFPSDNGGQVIVRFLGGQRDSYYYAGISYYSIWRSMDSSRITSSVLAVSLEDLGATSPRNYPATVLAENTPGGTQYWELLGTMPAAYLEAYSFAAGTRVDSTATNPGTHSFKVLAHESSTSPSRIWESNSMDGYSVDNLAPSTPMMLIADRIGSDIHLHWKGSAAPDLRDYLVYRNNAPGVEPVATNFLTAAEDTILVDANAPGGPLYYVVTAADVHGNQSGASNEAAVSYPTSISPMPSLRMLTVLDGYPNPFAAATNLTVGLPHPASVDVTVYDVAGRAVRQIALRATSAGWHHILFDGRDDRGRTLPSGIYFCRVSDGASVVTQRLVLVR